MVFPIVDWRLAKEARKSSHEITMCVQGRIFPKSPSDENICGGNSLNMFKPSTSGFWSIFMVFWSQFLKIDFNLTGAEQGIFGNP